MNLSKRAMLVTLNISQWTAKKLSKKGTQELCTTHNTTSQWAKASKTLVADEELKAISKVANEARTFHYKHTLPWSDNGQRLLPSKAFMDYTAGMREFDSRFNAAVENFCVIYPELIEQAKIALNGLFEAADYPEPHRIKSKYSFETIIDPLPESNDFRVHLSDDEVKHIQADIEERANKRTYEAMKDLWNRLFEVVTHIRDRLSDPKAIFRDSLIENAKELCSILPTLNVVEDSLLNQLSESVLQNIATVDPDSLRPKFSDNSIEAISSSNDRKLQARKELADKAGHICDLMAGYMG